MTDNRWPRENLPFDFSGEDSLKIQLTPFEVANQSSSEARSHGIKLGKPYKPLIFLMPQSFSTTINHDWSGADQLGTRGMQKVSKVVKSYKDAINTTANIMKEGNLGRIITQKYDVPVTYKDSNRRALTLLFVLANQGNAKTDVFKPVRLLEEYSCATKTGNLDFRMPCLFKVETIGSPLIYIEVAAIQSVQPTYFGPYQNGNPSKCELTVDFKEVTPLYRSSFSSGGSGNHWGKSLDRMKY